jgi:hypothetical protein
MPASSGVEVVVDEVYSTVPASLVRAGLEKCAKAMEVLEELRLCCGTAVALRSYPQVAAATQWILYTFRVDVAEEGTVSELWLRLHSLVEQLGRDVRNDVM